MWGKAQAKGKVGGKGKGKNGEQAANHTLPKTRITEQPFSGVVKVWKGKFGFITPDEEIEHPKAALRQNDLYVKAEDIEGAEELTAGAPCVFHIYEDSSGLGAEEVIVTGEPDPNFTPVDNRPDEQKQKAKAKGGQKAGQKAVGGKPGKASSWTPAAKGWGEDVWSAPAAKSSAKGWGKDAWSAPAAKSSAKGWGKDVWSAPKGAKGVASNFGTGKDTGKGTGKTKSKGPKQPLPKTRISEAKFTGTVESWKGKFGWVQPAEPIEHEKAAKRKGLLYVCVEDIEGDVKELTPEALVEFHIYEDDSGLGAEEVVQY